MYVEGNEVSNIHYITNVNNYGTRAEKCSDTTRISSWTNYTTHC